MITIALAGNPNCGKTSLFNRLTGLRQKVGNYPGVTVERRSGRTRLGKSTAEVIDLPGSYSLLPRSRDEAIAVEVIAGLGGDPPPDLVVVVVDATNLLRNLYLTLSLLELGRPAVIALNMMDLAREQALELDIEVLSRELGVPVVPMVARTGEGVERLTDVLEEVIRTSPKPKTRAWSLDQEGERLVARVDEALPLHRRGDGIAVWTLAAVAAAREESPEPIGNVEIDLPEDVRAAAAVARAALDGSNRHIARDIIEARYRAARVAARGALKSRPTSTPSRTDRIDAVLLHPVLGLLVFLLTMALLFQSIFAWADPLMGLIESGVGAAQSQLRSLLPEGAVADLLSDGMIGGVGNVIVFVPQIAFLFAFISILEDSGYLARAAFIADRVMARIGLHGRAFIPLLSGFACAVPAIMATRSIEAPKDRLVTILVTPLVSCSARLPVYTILIAALFASDQSVLGVFSVGGLLMLGMYLLSIFFTVGVAFVLKRTLLKSPTPPLVLELPPYRLPEPTGVLRRVADRCWVFIKDAGTVILACSMILWALLYFPRTHPDAIDMETRQAAIESQFEPGPERQAALRDLDGELQATQVANSIAGRVGRLIEPAFEPLGYDWKMGIGILASFAAREVFVSTLGLVYGVGDDADEESVPLREKLRREVDPDTGRPVYTPLVGLSLMVFFVIALQCMSTLAAIRRETKTWRWPLFAFGYASVLAWVVAFVVYQGGRALGFS